MMLLFTQASSCFLFPPSLPFLCSTIMKLFLREGLTVRPRWTLTLDQVDPSPLTTEILALKVCESKSD